MDPATAASILGVPVDAPRAEIERAFRRRARTEHPDVTGDPMSFAAATEAHDVLVHAQGWLAAGPGSATGWTVAPVSPQRGFDLPPVALALLTVLLIFGALVAGIVSASPYAPVEPVLRSAFLVATVLGYALTRRRLLGVLSAVAIIATAVATIAWISFGALLGGALMAPAIVLLLLHGRNRAL